MKISNIKIIKEMFLYGVFDIEYDKTCKYAHRGIQSRETENGVIEYYPNGETQFFSNEEIYSLFLKKKRDIPKDVLRAWGYQ